MTTQTTTQTLLISPNAADVEAGIIELKKALPVLNLRLIDGYKKPFGSGDLFATGKVEIDPTNNDARFNTLFNVSISVDYSTQKGYSAKISINHVTSKATDYGFRARSFSPKSIEQAKEKFNALITDARNAVGKCDAQRAQDKIIANQQLAILNDALPRLQNQLEGLVSEISVDDHPITIGLKITTNSGVKQHYPMKNGELQIKIENTTHNLNLSQFVALMSVLYS